MRKTFDVFAACLSILTAMAAAQTAQEPVPGNFFGMIGHAGVVRSRPFPSVPFGSLRLWDTHTKWLQIETSHGHYDWDLLDRYLSAAEQRHLDVLYTFGGVPTWASGDVNDKHCALQFRKAAAENWGPGSCHPPGDLKEDGSGSDQSWKDFVTALAKHAHGRIKYWEVWNEPQNLFFWNGTMPQMVRMTQDLRTIVKGIDPEAMILSPGTGWGDNKPESGKTDWNALAWTNAYLAAGGAKYIDIAATHGYVKGECPTGAWDLDQIPNGIAAFRGVMKKNGIQDLPLWNTEGSWNRVSKTCTTDPDMQVAFVGQFHLAMWSAGVKRMFWYAWDDPEVGGLWNEQIGPTPAAKAYAEVYKWMVGATLVAPCDKAKTQTSCAFTRPDGSEYLAIWDSAQTCSRGNCTTAPLKVDAKYVDYLDLAGGKVNIQNNTVLVGMKPIWLEAPAAGKKRKG